MAATTTQADMKWMPRACPVEAHGIGFGPKSKQRETPPDKPGGISFSSTLRCSPERESPPDKPVASVPPGGSDFLCKALKTFEMETIHLTDLIPPTLVRGGSGST